MAETVDAANAIEVMESINSSGATKKSSRSINHRIAEVNATKSLMKR